MDALTIIENFIIVYPIINYICEIFEIEKLSKKIYLFIVIYLTSSSLDLIDLNKITSNFCFYLVMLVFMNFSYIIFIKNKKYLTFFIVGNFILYYFSIRSIVISFYSIYLSKSMHEIVYIEKYYEISDIITVSIFFLFFLFFKKQYNARRLKLIPENDLKYNVVYLYIFILMMWGFDVPYYENMDFIWLNYYNAFNHLLCMILNYMIFIYSYIKNEKVEYEIKSNLFENQIYCNLQNYNNKALYIERLRSFKHDYKGIMSTAKILLENNNLSQLKILLNEVDSDFNNIENLYEEFSNNSLLQVIMSSFSNKCSDNNIAFEGKILIPKHINLTDYEKCRIFHNLLNNAFEACCNNLDHYNYIKIYTNVSELWFSAVIENTFDGYLKKYKEKFLSRKKAGFEHGFGIRNVIDIVEEKNGFINIENDNKIFKVTLSLPI